MPERASTGLPGYVEKDLRWLLGFLILVAVILYAIALLTVPALLQPTRLAAFTLLLAAHLFLHWFLLKIPPKSPWMLAYVLIQGGLFIAITLISGSPSLIFTLFSALIGEAIGTQGLNGRGILSAAFFILLLMAGFFRLFDLRVAGWLNLGTLAVVVSAVFYTILFKRQMEARTKAQSLLEQLELANRRLSEYAVQVEELTTAAERQRMARELHDTLSQGLAGLILQLEAVEAHLVGARPERALPIVQEAKEKARATLAESRQAITDLRQSGSRDLAEVVHQEAEHFSRATGVPCRVELGLPAPLPEPLTQTATRLVVEGLTNIARHARAKTVELQVRQDGREVEIVLCDDGVGFDPAAIQAGHFGLLGMQERVRLAGGSLDIQSGPGRGTRLTIRLPLETTSHE